MIFSHCSCFLVVTVTSILINLFNLAKTDLRASLMSFQVMKFDDLKELGTESAVKVCIHSLDALFIYCYCFLKCLNIGEGSLQNSYYRKNCL